MKNKKFTFDKFCKMGLEDIKKDGSYITKLYVIGESHNLVIAFADMPAEYNNRIKMFLGAGIKAAQQAMLGNLKGLYFGTEGYQLKLPDGEKWDSSKRIKDDPRNVEVLLMTEKNIENNKTRVRSYEMKRDATGKLTDLILTDKGYNSAKSPLLEAFTFGYTRAKITEPRH